MPATFYFRAVASDGKVRTGKLGGETDKAVARELRKQGLMPVYVGAAPQKSAYEVKLPAFPGGRRRDVLFFTQELSTLLNAGIPLDRALAITGELTERAGFRAVVLDILRVLKGGRSLADSLATYPAYFSDLFINMVRAGEASGALATVFERLSEFERSRDELHSYIVSAMIYPSLLASVGLGSIFILLNFVVPRFASVFSGSHMKIPLPTELMLESSRIVKKYWWMAALGATVLIGGMRAYISTVSGRMWWDTWRLKVPLLGDALRKAETARFARAMSTLVANAVPLVQSIGISGAILNNRYIAAALEAVSQGVKRGEGIAAPLRRVGVFPPLAAHLLTVGEETGRLDSMFARMAEIYENDTRAAVKRFTAIFEPLVILVMGILVGALILSMLLAITSINEVAG
jgi:general secretion pathway protein F